MDYRRVFEAAFDAQVVLDMDSRVVAASEGYLQTIGRARDAVLNRSIFELPPYAGMPVAAGALRAGLSMLERAPLPVYPVQLDDGSGKAQALWSRAKLRPITDASGRLEQVVHVLEHAPSANARFGAEPEPCSCQRQAGSIDRCHDLELAPMPATSRDVTQQAELQAERQRLHEERRLLEQRAQESQKLESLGVLAGGIAHDFNNLLMVILGSVSLVRCELGDTHPSMLHVEQMEEASRRAADLCRKLLAYAGKGRFLLQVTNLNRLIQDTTHLLQVAISKKAVLQFDLAPDLPSIVADTAQMHQVLMNLAINASDAIGDHSGTISIATSVVHADREYLDATFLAPDLPAGDFVCLEVSDTGSGMSAEVRARIFEPFYTTKFTGRGLGLSAVLGIVRGHGGALQVESEPGRGSRFKFLLPVATGETDPKAVSAATSLTLGVTGTVLLVDDEPAVREVSSDMLTRFGLRTLIAKDGNEAIRMYREHRDDIVCVLMDLTMPALDGVEAFRELRRFDPEIRVLLMSGYSEQEAIARFVGQGIAGFIQKPFTIGELARRMRSLLDAGEPE